MGITKRRKQPHLFREGARHAGVDQAIDTARTSVQRAALESVTAQVNHKHRARTVWDENTDAQTTSDTTDPLSPQHRESVSGLRDDLARTLRGLSDVQSEGDPSDQSTEGEDES